MPSYILPPKKRYIRAYYKAKKNEKADKRLIRLNNVYDPCKKKKMLVRHKLLLIKETNLILSNMYYPERLGMYVLDQTQLNNKSYRLYIYGMERYYRCRCSFGTYKLKTIKNHSC